MAKTKCDLHQRIFTLIAIIAINTSLFGCKSQSGDKNAGQLSQTEAVSLFNGYSFDGWDVDTNYFDIRDSVIIGGTLLGPIEDMVWITTQKEYADFELNVDVKLLGGDAEESANSGIWFRCSYNEERMLVGYEADMMINRDRQETGTDSLWWGSLHDPFRRDFDEFNIVGNQNALRKVLKLDDWNHFRIYCKGPDIKVWLNDVLTATYTETDKSIAPSGVIGLQLHDGPPSEVRFKNVMLKKL